MFRRREPRNRWKRLRNALWPEMGIVRLMRYYRHRMGRLSGTPAFIATGMAAGVAISFTPFIGLHLMLGTLLCWAIRGSFLAMVLGSVMAGNPWTFPVIWLMTYKLGKMMLGKEAVLYALPGHFSLSSLLEKPWELFLPMAMGSVPLFIVAWAVTFYGVRRIVAGYQETRRRRIHKHKAKG